MKLIRQVKVSINSWALLSILFALFILLPNLSIAVQLFSEPNDNWYHIKEFLLNHYIWNTLLLVLFTGLCTGLIGVSLAWLISAYDFPLRSFFKWGLILPLSIPPYIGAYTYHGILNYTGVIQTTLRNTFHVQVDQKYFDIMTIPGAIFIFTMFLFPYVYIITRGFLDNLSASLIENARLLGKNSTGIFLRIILPLSRAAIIGGVSLVALEVLNDYGVVKYFGIQTFSTAIFQAWFGMGDLNSAVRLSGILMLIVMGLFMLEKLIRGRKKYSDTSSKVRPIQRLQLTGLKGWFVFFYFFTVFSLAFLVPFIQLVHWMLITYPKVMSKDFLTLLSNSIFVAFIAALLIVLIALVIVNFSRLSDGLTATLISKITVMGYSIPGAIIAIGVLTLFLALDRQLFSFYKFVGLEPTLVLSLSIVTLLCAYIIRFLAIAYNSIESGFEKVGRTFTEASRMLGMTVTQTFYKVDLMMIRGAIFGGFILVFIDIVKELPLTLMLQPYNFYTLATKAYQYASDEMIHEAALPSILIILVSGVSIYFFHKVLEKERG